MNILINFASQKKGGGQNVALNFLHGLFEINNNHNQYFFLVVKDSEIHQFVKKRKQQNILTTSPSILKRIYQEYFKYPSIFKNRKIDIIYTYFGYGLFRGKIPQVCGVAVSNVFFPEIKFWQGGLLNVFIRKMVDKYRIYGIKKASALIFENKTMEERCHLLYHIPKSRTTFIPPSFNPDFEQEKLVLPELKKNTTKLLMLCGWQLNKNILKVPEIAYNLKKYNHAFQFIITAPNDNSKIQQEFSQLTKKFNVKEMISIIGPVKKQQLKSLYAQIDVVLLMSKLESFSNNIIEAWHFKKPLVVSDEKWARGICKNAAFYINRESPENIAESIHNLQSKLKLKNRLIEEGLSQLKYYPSIIEKTKQEIAFLEQIYNDTKSIS